MTCFNRGPRNSTAGPCEDEALLWSLLKRQKDLLSVLISSHLTWDRRLEHRQGGSRRKACSLWSYWNKRREEWEIPGKGRKLLGCWRGWPELSASAFSLWSWKWEHLIEVSFVSCVESSWVGTCGKIVNILDLFPTMHQVTYLHWRKITSCCLHCL